MAKYTVGLGDTIQDVALNTAGDLSAVDSLLDLNGIETYTPELYPLQELEYDETNIINNKTIVVARELGRYSSNYLPEEYLQEEIAKLYTELNTNREPETINISINNITGAIYDGSKIVACTSVGTIIISDDLGQTWSENSIGNYVWNDILYENGKYIVAGNNGSIGISDDAITWTFPTRVVTSNILRIRYNNGYYIFLSSPRIVYSQDLEIFGYSQSISNVNDNWTDALTYQVVTYLVGNFNNNYSTYATSTIFPTTWSRLAYTLLSAIYSCAVTNVGSYVGCIGQIAKLSNIGSAPEVIHELGSGRYNHIIYDNSYLWAVSSSGEIAFSRNGDEWGLIEVGDYSYNRVISINDKLYIFGNNGVFTTY